MSPTVTVVEVDSLIVISSIVIFAGAAFMYFILTLLEEKKPKSKTKA
jgi:hypothetical protein